MRARLGKIVPAEGVNGAGHVRLNVWVPPALKRALMLIAFEESRTLSDVAAALLDQALAARPEASSSE